MGTRKRRKFTQEFKEEAARFCKQGDRSIGQVAKDLDLAESALRRWVQQSDVHHSKSPERGLRRRVRTLEQEREMLKKAAAFFAKESE